MDVKLKVFQGTNAGQEVAITGQRFLIGRAEDCHLRPGSEMISRHHCVIVVDQSYAAVRDFGSKNGTYVNNERVAGERELKSGDQLRVGPLEFEISIRQGELGGRKKPAVHNPKEAAQRTAACQSDELDVAQWLDDPVGEAPSIGSASIEAAHDTRSIKLTQTEQIAIVRTRPLDAPQPQSASPPAAEPIPQIPQPPACPPPAPALPPAPAAAAVAPANVPKRALPSTFQMPEPEASAPVAEDKGGRLEKKKVFGKLPMQPNRPENTRSAAAEALEKMRKRQ